MSQTKLLRLPAGFDPAGLFLEKTAYQLGSLLETATDHRIYFDTFDWRLFQNGRTLRHSAGQLVLSNGEQIAQQAWRLKQEPQPILAADLPEGQLQTELLSLIEMRAVLPMAAITLTAQTFRILNEDEKTVAWLSLRAHQPQNDYEAIQIASVDPVRGYGREAEAIVKRLKKLGAVTSSPDQLLKELLEASDQHPGGFNPKPQITLVPDTAAHSAIRQLLRADLEVMHTTRPYIAQEIDTEFLHDFRVALRRSRSLLGQAKGVFPQAKTDHFKQVLRRLNHETNALRDLDVYLLAEEAYVSMLPNSINDHIRPLFDHLRQKRNGVLAATVDSLDSEAFNVGMADWEAFLLKRPSKSKKKRVQAPNGDRPILDVAKERIFKMYSKVVADGEHILITKIDEEMHELRIECKKLRYLLEFFSSLFPPKEISYLTKQLKKLQNNLGRFNDLCVQEAYLMAIADEMPESPDSRQTLLAIGSLVATLHEERIQVKSEFADTFKAFTTPENRHRFESRFGPPPELKKEKRKKSKKGKGK